MFIPSPGVFEELSLRLSPLLPVARSAARHAIPRLVPLGVVHSVDPVTLQVPTLHPDPLGILARSSPAVEARRRDKLLVPLQRQSPRESARGVPPPLGGRDELVRPPLEPLSPIPQLADVQLHVRKPRLQGEPFRVPTRQLLPMCATTRGTVARAQVRACVQPQSPARAHALPHTGGGRLLNHAQTSEDLPGDVDQPHAFHEVSKEAHCGTGVA